MFDVLTLLDLVHRLQFPIHTDEEFEAGEWGQVNILAGGIMRLEKVVGKITNPSFPVFQATADRHDREFTNQATVIHGVHIADTDQCDATGVVYTPGTPLTVEDGILVNAAGGDIVVAWTIIPPTANVENPNHLRYTTQPFSVLP
jgi:hypothetical protein